MVASSRGQANVGSERSKAKYRRRRKKCCRLVLFLFSLYLFFPFFICLASCLGSTTARYNYDFAKIGQAVASQSHGRSQSAGRAVQSLLSATSMR